jgi:hypothetical protein
MRDPHDCIEGVCPRDIHDECAQYCYCYYDATQMDRGYDLIGDSYDRD